MSSFRFAPLGCTLLALLLSSCAVDRAGYESQFAASGVAPVGRDVRVAVLDFEGDGGAAFADLLGQELLAAGIPTVERSRLRAVLDERDFAARHHAEFSINVVRGAIGGVLQASVLLTGAVVENQDRLTGYGKSLRGANSVAITVRAIDPKTGRVLWTGAVKAATELDQGEFGGPLTAWRMAAREIGKAVRETSYRGNRQGFENEAIPR
jgi:hypothetical protein